MFTVRVTYQPALGKGAELRTLLEGRTKAQQSQGIRANLTVQLFSQPTFVISRVYADLDAWDQQRTSQQEDPTFRAFQARLPQLLDHPQKNELFEQIIPALAGEPPQFVLRTTQYPAIGKGPDVRALIEERVKARQAQGGRVSLSAQVFNPDGPTFAINHAFANITALEQFHKSNAMDPAFRAYGAKLNPLLSRSYKSDLYEVLIPFPA